MSVSNKSRIVYIEAVRLIACFFVIFNHTSEWGYMLFRKYDYLSWRYWSYLFFSVICKVSVPLFFMITGALMLNKKEESIKKQGIRCIRIIFALIIFSFLAYLQQVYQGNENFDLLYFFKVFISSNTWMSPYWYLVAYLCYLLTLPLLRKFASSLNNMNYIYMVAVVFIIADVLPVVFYLISKGRIGVNPDFNVSWMASFIFFYPMLGYYLENKIDIFKVSFFCIIALWVINGIFIGITCYVTYVENVITGQFPQTYIMSFSMINAVCVYLTLKKIIINLNFTGEYLCHIPALIGEMGACTFGIYLIHGFLLREPRVSIYLKYASCLDCVPMIKELFRCLEIMIFAGVITFVFRRIPILKKIF